MKYIIIGAGGTGGILGFYMTKAGKDVTLIARNAHLEAMQKQGLSVEKMWINETETMPVGAESMESYEELGTRKQGIPHHCHTAFVCTCPPTCLPTPEI